MAWFLYFISIVYIVWGCCFILAPMESKENMRLITERGERRIWAAIAIIAGVLFLLSFNASSHPWIILLVGILAIVKGAVFFINPGGLYEKALKWLYGDLTEQAYRIYGIVALILGTVIFCWTV